MGPKEIRHDGVDWSHLNQSRDPVVSPSKCCNEPSGTVRGREYLDQLSDCWLLKKGSTPWS
jgi:hypothetical protein